MVGIPSITVTPNADNASNDIVLAAMPSGATKVRVLRRLIYNYGKVNQDFDTVVTEFVASGSFNDDNSGAGYDRYTVVRYIAVGIDDVTPDWSNPSKEYIVQVGTLLKYDMLAHVYSIRDILEASSDLDDYRVNVLFVDPVATDRAIYVIPDAQVPDIHYAAERVQVDLSVNIFVMTKHGDGQQAQIINHGDVETVLRLMDLNYRFNERTWNSDVVGVFYNQQVEGWQPEFAVTRIALLSQAQYAKFIP